MMIMPQGQGGPTSAKNRRGEKTETDGAYRIVKDPEAWTILSTE